MCMCVCACVRACARAHTGSRCSTVYSLSRRLRMDHGWRTCLPFGRHLRPRTSLGRKSCRFRCGRLPRQTLWRWPGLWSVDLSRCKEDRNESIGLIWISQRGLFKQEVFWFERRWLLRLYSRLPQHYFQ